MEWEMAWEQGKRSDTMNGQATDFCWLQWRKSRNGIFWELIVNCCPNSPVQKLCCHQKSIGDFNHFTAADSYFSYEAWSRNYSLANFGYHPFNLSYRYLCVNFLTRVACTQVCVQIWHWLFPSACTISIGLQLTLVPFLEHYIYASFGSANSA